MASQSTAHIHTLENTPPRLPASPPPTRHGKEKRLPSITPRKFKRFFAPRSRGSGSSASRRALVDITAPANNTRPRSDKLRPFEDLPTISRREAREPKRRKILHTPDSSPIKQVEASPDLYQLQSSQDDEIPSSPCRRPSIVEELCEEIKPRLTISQRGQAGRLLQRSFASSQPNRQHFSYPIPDWQCETASFYSSPDSLLYYTSTESGERCIPFCSASCNTNTLFAIGDEEGRVRLLESAEGQGSIRTPIVHFRPHTNAIIDMSFSEDDSLLATASGDQTARVVDMSTQTTMASLNFVHTASLKQVRFQPGAANNSILATCSRDGSINIWDLRCKGADGPVAGFEDELAAYTGGRTVKKAFHAAAVDSICNAHSPLSRSTRTQQPTATDAPLRGETSGLNGDISVTAIQFLPAGQEHILLSASAANASVRLWDIRSIRSSRNRSAVPLSYTRLPDSHHKWRHFGISSMNLSGDGSRLYTVCKDNTVYAYSTNHLLLGHAPELSATSRPRRGANEVVQGLGPLYGFRHPTLHVSSFYVKSAIRKAKDGRSEMLAVGSSYGGAILFPTDERYLDFSQSNEQPSLMRSSSRPQLRRSGSSNGLGRVGDEVPISQRGTALIRGHDKEVGALTWTSGGDLVTVGDDFLVRVWYEGDKARSLRVGGETGGRRWGCGWADVAASFDDDDD